MSDFTKEDFFRDLVLVLRKHNCTYLDVKNAWVGGDRFEFDYCNEDGQGDLSIRRILPAIEFDCVKWGRE